MVGKAGTDDHPDNRSIYIHSQSSKKIRLTMDKTECSRIAVFSLFKEFTSSQNRSLQHVSPPIFIRLPVFVKTHHVYRDKEHTSELQSPDHLVCRLLLE